MANKKLRVLLSETYDPWFNLATEDWIFQEMDPAFFTLFLWRNDNTVVIGRCQNPWTECNLEKMEQEGIKLARRQSGGGAVFHDLGNTNFTFLCGKKHYDKQANNQIIIQALKEFDIRAHASGRNDIVVDGKKISGSAFKESHDRAFHHGTLLIDANLGKLSQYLTPGKKKLQAKGLASVKSRVANLCQFNSNIDHKSLCQKIIDQFFRYHQSECPVETLDDGFLKTVPSLVSYYEKLKDWQWRFGASPKFSHHLQQRFEWGGLDIYIEMSRGIIQNVQVYSDCLYPDMIETLAQNLQNISYRKAEVENAVQRTCTKFPDKKTELQELSQWLATEIS